MSSSNVTVTLVDPDPEASALPQPMSPSSGSKTARPTMAPQRRKHIAEMIINAGKKRWKEKKISEPSLLCPQSAAPARIVEDGLDLLQLTDNACVYDLGCGDGRWLINAAQRLENCRCVGVDISHTLLAKGRQNVLEMGLQQRVSLKFHDLLTGLPDDIRKATTIILYLLPECLHLIGNGLGLACANGTRILSVGFPIKFSFCKLLRTKHSEGRKMFLYTLTASEQSKSL